MASADAATTLASCRTPAQKSRPRTPISAWRPSTSSSSSRSRSADAEQRRPAPTSIPHPGAHRAGGVRSIRRHCAQHHRRAVAGVRRLLVGLVPGHEGNGPWSRRRHRASDPRIRRDPDGVRRGASGPYVNESSNVDDALDMIGVASRPGHRVRDLGAPPAGPQLRHPGAVKEDAKLITRGPYRPRPPSHLHRRAAAPMLGSTLADSAHGPVPVPRLRRLFRLQRDERGDAMAAESRRSTSTTASTRNARAVRALTVVDPSLTVRYLRPVAHGMVCIRVRSRRVVSRRMSWLPIDSATATWMARPRPRG